MASPAWKNDRNRQKEGGLITMGKIGKIETKFLTTGVMIMTALVMLATAVLVYQ